jgi:D-tyrosyl-tRNA(Tyr) deacylase
LQRVSRASVKIHDEENRVIGAGLVLLVGIGKGDDEKTAAALAAKVAHLRIFEDEAGRMNLSALEVGAEILAISQFTLYADCRRGRRPSFTDASAPAVSEPLYRAFVNALKNLGFRVEQGEFGARMEVEIHNDGPVTIWLDSDD